MPSIVCVILSGVVTDYHTCQSTGFPFCAAKVPILESLTILCRTTSVRLYFPETLLFLVTNTSIEIFRTKELFYPYELYFNFIILIIWVIRGLIKLGVIFEQTSYDLNIS